MRDQSGRSLDDFCNVHRDALSGAKTAEIQQSIRDCLAAESFVANQTKVLAQIFRVGRVAESALLDSLFKRLSARRDCRQWIVDFVHDAGGESADGRQLLSAGNGPVCLDANRDVLANRDDVRNLFAFVGPHGNLADQPVMRVAGFRYRFLFDSMNLASGEDPAKFAFQQIATLLG